MKVTISKKRLVAAIKTVTPATAKRAPLPILAGIFVQATSDGLRLEATDLEAAVRTSVTDASTTKAGTMVVPAKAFAKAVSAMPDDDVVLDGEAGERPKLTIESGSRRVTLEGMSADDWPRIATGSDGETFAQIRGRELADALQRVALCASDDEARLVLTGVALMLDAKSNTLQVVATDSYRLGAVTIEAESTESPRQEPVIVPARIAKVIAKQLRGRRAQVSLGLRSGDNTGTRVVVRFEDTEWTARTIEGEFPNWRQLLPEPTGASCDIAVDELASALKAVAAVRSNGSPVRMSFGDRCSIALSERDLGEVREELTDTTYQPDGVGSLEVGFNPDYLTDALRFCGGDRVRLWIRDGLKPALFGTPEARYLLMPVRTS